MVISQSLVLEHRSLIQRCFGSNMFVIMLLWQRKIHHPLISKLFMLPTHFFLLAICLVIPSTVFIYCYSHVIYHVWFNAEENKATNTALLKSRRKPTKLFIILTVTLKANRETVCEKRTDNKLRADLFIACSHRFDGESHYLCFSLPKISPRSNKDITLFLL